MGEEECVLFHFSSCFSPVAEFKHKKISMSSNIVLLVSKNPEGEVRKQDKKVLSLKQ